MKANLVTLQDFNKAAKRDTYFLGKWCYYAIVVSLLESMKFTTSLELGPYKFPLIKDSDIMDRVLIFKDRCKYNFDATLTPWNIIKDKAYDVFVGLMVFEHLEGKQPEVFKEVMRISKNAIIGVPYKWKRAKHASHIGINEDTVAKWTLNYPPSRVIIVHGKYIIYLFEFDKKEDKNVK